MTLWAIVPVKPLRRGKSRLAGVLTENERTFLNYAMLENTLRSLTAVASVQQVLVVSRDPAALSLARDYQARTLQEDDENTDLNLALKRATVVAQMYSASSVMILPADLPLIQPSDVEAFINKLVKPPMVVIAPDRREDGTNALLMSPAGLIEYEYGAGSFKKHMKQIEHYHVRHEIVKTFSIELDLDLPEDLEDSSKTGYFTQLFCSKGWIIGGIMAERVALYLQDAHELRDGLSYVKYAEDRGFEAVWQAESRLVRDAIVPMAAYASVTERIKVGSGVINNWTRNIGLLAATFLNPG